MRVAELMTADVITADPETTLRELASLLVTEHIGGAPVVVGERILGVVSATDLLDFDADAPGSPRERPGQARELADPPEDLARDVEAGDEAPSVYFAELREDVGANVVERFDRVDSPEWNVLDEHVVSEIMTEKVFAIPPTMEVREAAGRMLGNDVHRALVVEEGRLIGILTTRDLLRAVAEYGLGADRAEPVAAGRWPKP